MGGAQASFPTDSVASRTPAPGTPPEIEILARSEEGVRLVFSLPELLFEDVHRGGETFRLATIPGGGLEEIEGETALPTYTRLLAVPAGFSGGMAASASAPSRRCR